MPEGNEWSQAWLDTQRQYWDTLFNWSKAVNDSTLPRPSSGNNNGSLDEWWKNASAMLPASSMDTYRRMLDAGRGFFQTGELFWNMAREAQETGENWRESLEQSLEGLRSSLQEGVAQAADAWSGFAGGFGLHGDAWQDFMKSLGQSPVHVEALTGFNAGEAWNRLMRAPALGYTREWQEKAQQWGILAGEYTKAAQEYAALLNATNRKAVDLLGRRLVELAQKNEVPATLRGMYDLWVDCGEDAYAELVDNDDYLRTQGHLTNSLMRLRQHEQNMFQDVFSALNIPGRRELDTALCRLQETRREVRDLRDAVEDAELLGLREELARLRDEVNALKTGKSSASGEVAKRPLAGTAKETTPRAKAAVKKAPAPARKTTARKKVTAK